MKTKTIIHRPRKVLPGILLAVFLESFCTSIFVPTVLVGIEEARNANIAVISSLGNYAILVAVHAVLQFFAAPLLGQYSDRFGRKVALAYSLSGAAVGHAIFLYGVATANFGIMIIGRAVDGITGGTQAISRSVIADVAHNSTRVRYFGLLGGVFGFGSILGTVLGTRSFAVATVRDSIVFSPFSLAVGLSVLNIGLVFVLLPETFRLTRRWRLDWSSTVSYIARASNAHAHRVLFVTSFLYMSGTSLMLAYLPYLVQRYVGYSVIGSEQYILYILVCSAMSQALLAPVLASMIRSHVLVKVSLLCSVLALPLFVFHPFGISAGAPLIFGALFAVPLGLTIANITALVSGTSSKEMQGEILGIDVAMHSAAQLLPLLLAVRVAERYASAVMSLSAIFLVAAAWLFISYYRTPAYALKVNKV